jgi:hypothetical protein
MERPPHGERLETLQIKGFEKPMKVCPTCYDSNLLGINKRMTGWTRKGTCDLCKKHVDFTNYQRAKSIYTVRIDLVIDVVAPRAIILRLVRFLNKWVGTKHYTLNYEEPVRTGVLRHE